MATRRSRATAPVGAARWMAAGIIVAAIGGAATLHVVRSARPDADALEAIVGGENNRPYQSPAGLAVRLTDAQRTALQARIAADPLDAPAYAWLALDLSARGDRARPSRLVAHAIAIEPRTRIAWLWRLDAQLRAGKTVEAAASVLRLLAFDPGRFEGYIQILAALTSDRRNIPQISSALQGNPNWRGPYLLVLERIGFDPNIRFAIMQPSTTRIIGIESERASFVNERIAKGDYERAYLGWLEFLPDAALTGIDTPYDGTFAGLPGPPPFNWTLSAGDGERAEANRGLSISYAGRRPAALATQTVLLEPGTYRLRSTVAPPDGAVPQSGGTQLAWTMTCLPSRQPVVTQTLDLNARGVQASQPFVVPQDCAATILSLSGSASEFPIAVNTRITMIKIDRLSAAPSASTPAATAGPSAIPSPASTVPTGNQATQP